MMDEFQEKWPEPRWLAPNRVASMPDAHGIAGVLDQLVAHIGRAAAWLTLILVLLVAGDVLFRYIWHVSSVAEQEFEWHVLAVIAMLGASYTLQQGEHVRVDIFYQRYSLRLKRWLDILMPALFVVPTMLFIAWQSLHFVGMSWEVNEGSPDPGGLPGRYLIKAFVPLGFFLIAIQGIAMTLYGITNLNQPEQTTHG
jgi:TRAP-type mannitol/chloroaromatic compound transport system permease small subunit